MFFFALLHTFCRTVVERQKTVAVVLDPHWRYVNRNCHIGVHSQATGKEGERVLQYPIASDANGLTRNTISTTKSFQSPGFRSSERNPLDG